jgi:hypothetical protein
MDIKNCLNEERMSKNCCLRKNSRLFFASGMLIATILLFPTFASVAQELVTNGDFSSTTITNWTLAVPDTSVKGGIESGQYVITRKAKAKPADTTNWGIQLSYKGLSLEKGKTYVVSFIAKADSVFIANVNVGMNKSPWGTYSGFTQFTITSTLDTFTFEFKMDSADNACRIVFDVGFMKGPGKLFLDNISVKADAGSSTTAGELIKNGDFSSASLAMWKLNFRTAKSKATMSVVNGELEVNLTKMGNYPDSALNYDIQLAQTGIKLEKGKNYKLKWDARTTVPYQMSNYVAMNKDPWAAYSSYNAVLYSTDMDVGESLEFTMDSATDAGARVAFDMGDVADSTPRKVYFDNISLTCTDCNTNVAEVFAASANLAQLHGIMKGRTIEIAGLSSPATLRIYNASGKMVLAFGEKTPATGSVSVALTRELAKGVYLVKVNQGASSPATLRLINQ